MKRELLSWSTLIHLHCKCCRCWHIESVTVVLWITNNLPVPLWSGSFLLCRLFIVLLVFTSGSDWGFVELNLIRFALRYSLEWIPLWWDVLNILEGFGKVFDTLYLFSLYLKRFSHILWIIRLRPHTLGKQSTLYKCIFKYRAINWWVCSSLILGRQFHSFL